MRYNIDSVLQVAYLRPPQELYYLSHTQSRRLKKYLLVIDEEFEQLFVHQLYQTIYVVHNSTDVGVGTSQHNSYVHSFDVHETTSFEHDTQSTQYDGDLEQIWQMTSTDWLGGDENLYSRSYYHDLNFE